MPHQTPLAALRPGPSASAMGSVALGAELPEKSQPRKAREPRVEHIPRSGPLTGYEGDRLISVKAVMAITSWSRASIRRLVIAKKLPPPIALGSRRVAFKESEILAYVAAQQRRPTTQGEQVESAKPAPQHARA